MKNKIDSEIIINTTLELINEKGEASSVNLREIARRLGCAHTNLYNYFHSLDDILWEALQQALIRLMDFATEDLAHIEDEEKKMEYYFSRVLEFYLNNKGWFRLIWFERLNGSRPKKTLDAIIHTVDSILSIFHPPYSSKFTREEMHFIIHNVHCYLHGEIFIYIAGRGLIKDEAGFKEYVVLQCMKMFHLYTA